MIIVKRIRRIFFERAFYFLTLIAILFKAKPKAGNTGYWGQLPVSIMARLGAKSIKFNNESEKKRIFIMKIKS